MLRFTKGERFYPIDVERYVARSSLWVRHPNGEEDEVATAGELDMARLVCHREYAFGSVEHLRFSGTPSVSESALVLSEVHRLRKQEDTLFRPGLGRLARVGFFPLLDRRRLHDLAPHQGQGGPREGRSRGTRIPPDDGGEPPVRLLRPRGAPRGLDGPPVLVLLLLQQLALGI